MDDRTPCREIVEIVTDYLEDALTPEQRNRVVHHLRRCPDCATYLDQMLFVIRLAGSLRDEPDTSRPDEALTLALLDWHVAGPDPGSADR